MELYHQPFCPHSRFIRLVLNEWGFDYNLIIENLFERREAFLILNPAATLPVLIDETVMPVPMASLIIEYLEETFDKNSSRLQLMPPHPIGRVEVRRLLHWFNDKFFTEVSRPFGQEMIDRRFLPSENGEERLI